MFYFISSGFSLNEPQQKIWLLGTRKRFVPSTLEALRQVAASMPGSRGTKQSFPRVNH